MFTKLFKGRKLYQIIFERSDNHIFCFFYVPTEFVTQKDLSFSATADRTITSSLTLQSLEDSILSQYDDIQLFMIRKQPKENNTRADWFKIVFIDRNLELPGAVDVMMVRAKRIYILMIKSKQDLSFFSSMNFLKVIKNLLSSSLLMYSLSGLAPTAFLVLHNFYSYFYHPTETR